jgi:hypothetical protein
MNQLASAASQQPTVAIVRVLRVLAVVHPTLILPPHGYDNLAWPC